jgi:hypothetical protein
LAESDEFDRFDFSEGLSVLVDHLGWMKFDPTPKEIGPTAARGDEADVLTVGLVRSAKPEAFGMTAHLGLGHRADWEQATSKTSLVENVYHVTLVLGPVVPS